MIDKLKKALAVSVNTDASAKLEELTAEMASYKATAEAALAQAADQISALTAQLAEAGEKLAELSQFAEAAEAEKARLIAEAAATKMASRKQKITAAVGTERADALMSATENLNDESFESVVAALNISATTEAKSTMFVEIGAAATADVAKMEESPEMKILKSKYGKN